MERKKRYCTQCGDKTNEMHCIICGRATKSIGSRFEETYLNLLSDDIETFDEIQKRQDNSTRVYSNDINDTQENLDHIENNMKFHKRNAYRR